MDIKISQPTAKEVREKEIAQWAIWTSDVDEFDWEYLTCEQCYILEGEVEVLVGDEIVRIQPGDFVEFPRGLRCRWHVLQPIRKHFQML